MTKRPRTLEILLAEVLVGHLTLLPDDRILLAFDEIYHEDPFRPTLSLSYGSDLAIRRPTRGGHLDPFFSNLLPEGPLRSLIAERAGVPKEREFFLLAQLGEDLPGAVTARPLGGWDPAEAAALQEGRRGAAPVPPDQQLKFSLAGVQLKFSGVRGDGRLTIPVTGRGGDWIVKLPDDHHVQVPENEFAMLSWARHAGITVPEFELVRIGDIDRLPVGGYDPDRSALAIRRFDRLDDGTRVHIEDAAQALGLRASEKYGRTNFETIANLIWTAVGSSGIEEFIRRLVFVVASGNGDAHLKNWSLIYEGRVKPSLAPAYDLVSTIQYLPDDDLALNFNRSKRFSEVTLDGFRRLARRIGAPEDWIASTAEREARRILDAWTSLEQDLPLPDDWKVRLEERFDDIPLLK